MNQHFESEEWPSIQFEGEFLPQSVSGISILLDRDFTGRTADWIWRLRHCKEVWKNGEADWCLSSASEICDHLLEHRDEIVAQIRARLGPHGFDETTTIDEWLTALSRIRVLAQAADGDCRWIAGRPTERAEETRRRILAFLDKNRPADT
ncbi:MAG: hypothetical protein R3F19_32545 [Verrucomicrobiales bacterium]